MDKRYDEFFKLFKEREYFKCHEVLEEIWIEETQYDTRDHPAIVLLLFSVALLHWESSNFKGAIITFENALNTISKVKKELKNLKIDYIKFELEIKMAITHVKKEEKYREIEIPFLK